MLCITPITSLFVARLCSDESPSLTDEDSPGVRAARTVDRVNSGPCFYIVGLNGTSHSVTIKPVKVAEYCNESRHPTSSGSEAMVCRRQPCRLTSCVNVDDRFFNCWLLVCSNLRSAKGLVKFGGEVSRSLASFLPWGETGLARCKRY